MHQQPHLQCTYRYTYTNSPTPSILAPIHWLAARSTVTLVACTHWNLYICTWLQLQHSLSLNGQSFLPPLIDCRWHNWSWQRQKFLVHYVWVMSAYKNWHRNIKSLMNATSFCPNGLLCAVAVLSSHSLELRLQWRDTSAAMTQASNNMATIWQSYCAAYCAAEKLGGRPELS